MYALIAIITFYNGGTVEKTIWNKPSLEECLYAAKGEFVPPSAAEPIEGEKSRVYECREVKL